VGILSKLLKGVCIDGDTWELVLVNIVDHNLIIVRKAVSHDEVLVQSGWQNGVSTIVDVFTDDVDTARRSTEVKRFLVVDLFESFSQCLETGLMFSF